MELANVSKNKVKVLCVVVALLAISLIGVAYAYSTHVTGNGDISGEYYAVDIYEGEVPYTEKLTKLISNDDGTYNGGYTYGDGTKYYVHIEGNVIETAYLYGYFTLNSTSKAHSGALIKEVSIKLSDAETNSDITVTLKSNAFENPITTVTGEPVNKNLQIKEITVSFYTEFDSQTSVIIDGDPVDLSVAKSVANLSFVFWASSEDILSAA